MADYFAVLDTETNWNNEVMSVGIVIAEDGSFEPIDRKYIIIKDALATGGKYSYALKIKGQNPEFVIRKKAVKLLMSFLDGYGINALFAYNAPFDARCLPELSDYEWYDILKLAAYKQHNPSIPEDARCCSTGRLKSGYGVENIMHMFGETGYEELHNALEDAQDELRIMKYLNHPIGKYPRI
jgi:hypothetical protein